MNHPDTTEQQAQHADKLVSWTGCERLRFLWYRLRLTVQEMNYATRRVVELQAPWITGDRPADAADAAAAGRAAGLCGFCVSGRVWWTRWPLAMVEPAAVPAGRADQQPAPRAT